ncbi:MAG: helix-turn-helix transcriptional regulator [Selenomonadaceae bacterium]|nr:helix-turn-helix transcriptional regulator [Selenomonadaceae bacterium]
MKTGDVDSNIVAFTSDVMRKFFEDNDFSSLVAHLSPDVLISVKSGSFISNKDDAIRMLEISRYFKCSTEQKDCRIKQLADNLYLADCLVALTSSDFAGTRNVRATLIINTGKKSYKIHYLSFNKICDNNSCNNIFPVEKKLPRKERGAAREEMLINFVLEGLNNREIAKRLSLAEITIKKALSKIYQRFGVKNKTELLAKLTKK